MLVKALGALLVKNLLQVQKEIIEDAAKEIALQELREKARRYFLAHVAKTYADEYKYNSEAYVKSLELMELEIDLPKTEIDNLVYKFQSTLSNFENIFEQKLPNSLVTRAIIENMGARPMGGVYGGGQSSPQVNPVMAYVNKTISPPDPYQPYVLRREQIDLIEAEALRIWDELADSELSF